MEKLDTALLVAAASGILSACGPSDARIAENRGEILSKVESSVQDRTKELLDQGYVEYCRGVMVKKIVTKGGKAAYEIMTVVERYGKVLSGSVANPDYVGAHVEYR